MSIWNFTGLSLTIMVARICFSFEPSFQDFEADFPIESQPQNVELGRL